MNFPCSDGSELKTIWISGIRVTELIENLNLQNNILQNIDSQLVLVLLGMAKEQIGIDGSFKITLQYCLQ